MAQKFSSPTGISWNWKVLSLVTAARVFSGSLWVLLFAFRLLTQTILFSRSFFKQESLQSSSPNQELVRTLAQKPSQVFSHLPLWMQKGLLLCKLRSASSLSNPGCYQLFSLGISPTTVGADLPTWRLIIGFMWVTENLCKNDTLIAGYNRCCLFLSLIISNSSKFAPLEVLVWVWRKAGWGHFSPQRGFCM